MFQSVSSNSNYIECYFLVLGNIANWNRIFRDTFLVERTVRWRKISLKVIQLFLVPEFWLTVIKSTLSVLKFLHHFIFLLHDVNSYVMLDWLYKIKLRDRAKYLMISSDN